MNYVQVWRENEMFTIRYWRSSQTADFNHFALLFCWGRQRNVPSCRMHVQSEQSHCFFLINPLTPRVKPWVIHWNAVEQYFAVVQFVISENLSILDLALSGVKVLISVFPGTNTNPRFVSTQFIVAIHFASHNRVDTSVNFDELICLWSYLCSVIDEFVILQSDQKMTVDAKNSWEGNVCCSKKEEVLAGRGKTQNFGSAPQEKLDLLTC